MLNGVIRIARVGATWLAGATGLLGITMVSNAVVDNALKKREEDYLRNAPPGTPPENWSHPGVVYIMGNPLLPYRVRAGQYDPNVLNQSERWARAQRGWPQTAPNYRGDQSSDVQQVRRNKPI